MILISFHDLFLGRVSGLAQSILILDFFVGHDLSPHGATMGDRV